MPVGDGGDALARKRALPSVDLSRTEAEQHAQLQRLIDFPQPAPGIRYSNRAIGVADELGRLILSFVLVAMVLIVLAFLVTPWLWIAVVVWIGFFVWTIVALSRRPEPDAAPAIKR
ncbi:MAG: hypothetical protein M3N46_02485 [Actinomycetota bacterium]|nr:hypothetical protein [Actinomycetota bacterium]